MTTAFQCHRGAAMQLGAAGKVPADGLPPREDSVQVTIDCWRTHGKKNKQELKWEQLLPVAPQGDRHSVSIVVPAPTAGQVTGPGPSGHVQGSD